MRFVRDLVLLACIALVSIFAVLKYQEYREARREQETEAAVMAVGAVIQVHAQRLETPGRNSLGCPVMFEGRPLTRSIYRESESSERALVCFYAEDSQMRSQR